MSGPLPGCGLLLAMITLLSAATAQAAPQKMTANAFHARVAKPGPDEIHDREIVGPVSIEDSSLLTRDVTFQDDVTIWVAGPAR